VCGPCKAIATWRLIVTAWAHDQKTLLAINGIGGESTNASRAELHEVASGSACARQSSAATKQSGETGARGRRLGRTGHRQS
jgi:hypothetical protein